MCLMWYCYHIYHTFKTEIPAVVYNLSLTIQRMGLVWTPRAIMSVTETCTKLASPLKCHTGALSLSLFLPSKILCSLASYLLSSLLLSFPSLVASSGFGHASLQDCNGLIGDSQDLRNPQKPNHFPWTCGHQGAELLQRQQLTLDRVLWEKEKPVWTERN